MKLSSLIKSIIYQLKCRKLCNKIENDKKVEFEKEIIKVLKKFNLFNKDFSTLQKVTIIVDADELPVVKLEYSIIDRDYLDKKKISKEKK